jgi:hypothetical protein
MFVAKRYEIYAQFVLYLKRSDQMYLRGFKITVSKFVWGESRPISVS